MPNENGRISAIAEFLIGNENVCLVIRGAWGVGKTYLWREVEKEIGEKHKEKKVVYIDLFGKESYKQILEEIVLKVNGSHNEILDKVTKLASNAIKLTGAVNINLDSIFSIFKKEDFKNIIVCFDNIERKSNKLPLDEILGLVNLLKEDKLCSVVMILNKDELEKQELNNQNKQEANNDPKPSDNELENPRNWYEIHKEKVIDYEITIENNDEVARKIIENNLKWDIENTKQEIIDIILDYFKQELNDNLRLLIKLTQHIDYFNKHCFSKCYENDKRKEFLGALEWYYKAMITEMKRYYSPPMKDEEKFSGSFLYCKTFLSNLLKLDEKELQTLQKDFSEAIKNETRRLFGKKWQDYYFGNLSDKEYAKGIQNLLQNTKNYVFGNGILYPYNYYITLLEQYKQITKEELHSEKDKIIKQFIEVWIEKESGVDINDDFIDMGFDIIRDLIHEEEKYKQFYEECKSKKYGITDIDSFIKNKSTEEIRETFSSKHIVRYNNFPIDKISEVFQNNNEFCKEFFKYFSSHLSDNSISKYDLENCLFQAYKKFLNQEEYKVKKEEVKKALEKNHSDSLIFQLLNEE
ncbi:MULTISPECIES: P-loop NTPase fold protein [Helicobacter]|uniref:KAP NTPase domain-containing protein n=1 Tax=Helicobacter ganmani TaxID=60246 RepID=A0A3D8IIM7_9HELI|nr:MULTISPECIES: P-loop NTPase fold protein [Helicobacter]RDU64514.1 hypothetical protein CQA43_01560 [Helicobacter ganmani]